MPSNTADDFFQTGWVIIGRNDPPCMFCQMAKKTLDRYGCFFVFMDYNEHPILAQFIEDQRLSTVPQIYHRGVHVGGFDKLDDYLMDLGESLYGETDTTN